MGKIDLVSNWTNKSEYDKNNAIITIHAGAGGTEAQDWAEMVFNMYKNWCNNNKFKYTIMYIAKGDVAGIKSASLIVQGKNAYAYLKSEQGVHRLVRVSPFDAQKRRHTSFCGVDVIPELVYDGVVKINDNDLEIQTFRSGGPGGQHQNKTESGVRIIHKPTGLVAESREERSQIQNRENCMNILYSKLLRLKESLHKSTIDDLRGILPKIEWGNSIRSYVFMPYQQVKDERTGTKTSNIDKVLHGEINMFINNFLQMKI